MLANNDRCPERGKQNCENPNYGEITQLSTNHKGLLASEPFVIKVITYSHSEQDAEIFGVYYVVIVKLCIDFHMNICYDKRKSAWK